jgi:hypothetical protein
LAGETWRAGKYQNRHGKDDRHAKFINTKGVDLEGGYSKLARLENNQTHKFSYENNIKTDKFSGNGTIIEISTGNIYTGDFKDGVKHGYGKLTQSDGTTIIKTVDGTDQQGYWINDSFIGTDTIDVNPDISTKYMSNTNFTVDIFINGGLERSHTFKNDEIPIFKDSDIMMVGETTTKDGLYGSICNIVYYKKPLSQLAIIYNYNLLTIRNPPI